MIRDEFSLRKELTPTQRHRLRYPERGAAKTLKYRENHPEKNLFRMAKERSKKYNIPFDIEVSDIEIPVLCPVLKKPLVSRTSYAPSIDRIDNSKGYVKGNIQVISKRANSMKSDATVEDLRLFAEWINTLE